MSEAQNRIRTFPEFRCLKIITLVIQTTPGHNAVPFTFLTTADNPLSHIIYCFNHSCYVLFKDTGNSTSCTTINSRISEYWTIRDMQGGRCHLIWNTVLASILWNLGGKIKNWGLSVFQLPNVNNKHENLGQTVQSHWSIIQCYQLRFWLISCSPLINRLVTKYSYFKKNSNLYSVITKQQSSKCPFRIISNLDWLWQITMFTVELMFNINNAMIKCNVQSTGWR